MLTPDVAISRPEVPLIIEMLPDKRKPYQAGKAYKLLSVEPT